MKNIFFLLLLPVLSFAQAGVKKTTPNKVQQVATSSQFSISGNIIGLQDGTVTIKSTAQGEPVVAKAPTKGGQFNLVGSVEEPGLYWITLGNEQPQYIFLENAPIRISGKKTDIKNIQVEGSQSHTDFLQFRKTFDPLFANLNALSLDLQKAGEEKKASLMEQYTAAIASLNKNVGQFVAARPASHVSVFLLTVTRQVSQDLAELEERFQALHPSVKASGLGKELESFIAFSRIGAVGSDAMEFTQNDVEGKPVSLSQFKGKYVLIDFWASWCKPCRLENPNVVKNFNKFKNKNFTVLGVSLDQQKDPWVKAIDADKLTWTHVSDLQFWNNAVAQMYHVQSIPQNFLIDPKGKIIAKDLRGEDLEKKLCELLGCAN